MVFDYVVPRTNLQIGRGKKNLKKFLMNFRNNLMFIFSKHRFTLLKKMMMLHLLYLFRNLKFSKNYFLSNHKMR